MSVFSLKTDLWSMIYLGWVVAIKQRASGAVRFVPRSKLPDWNDLYCMSDYQFDSTARKYFHSAGRC